MASRENLRKNLKLARKEAGLTQAEFAEQNGIGLVQVNKWENGHVVPDLDRIDFISKIYNKPTSWFLESHEGAQEDTVEIPRSWAKILTDLYRSIFSRIPGADPLPECLAKLTQNQRGFMLNDNTLVLTDRVMAADGITISEQNTSFDPLAFAKRLFMPT